MEAGSEQALLGQPARPFDTAGQICPRGLKPSVRTSLWEEEGTVLFEVTVEGVSLNRREDNHFINGTMLFRLLNATGEAMALLDREKTSHAVEDACSPSLKGVWIPYDRALDLANKYRVAEKLYPLFVHDLAALIYRPETIP